MIALRGTVAQLKDDEIVSTSLEAPRGVTVDTPCDIVGPDDAFTELITSMTADERGGWIDAATIAYSSGGKGYSSPSRGPTSPAAARSTTDGPMNRCPARARRSARDIDQASASLASDVRTTAG